MKVQLFSVFLFILLVFNTQAQQTVGLFLNTPNAFEGYTLFAPINSTETYLIDNCGEKVHSWSSNYRPGLSCYLLEDGILLRTGRIQMMGVGSGVVEMIDWDGNVIWDYSAFATHGKQHHDIELLPNGNILLIVNDERPQSELEAVGGSTNNATIISEQVIEIEPDLNTGGASVVWEWKAWGHLIQDIDITKPNFGTIAQHPQRIDINFLDHTNPDWLHFNGIDYHEDFNQIILSSRRFNEFWIIDHSTTTNEAADTTGGYYGKGGDLLYRWGNPRAYDQGTPANRKLFLQHHAHWIPAPLVDEGKILLFNNQAGTPQGQDYSTVNIVDTPVDANGFYSYNGGAYEPVDFDWIYQATNPTDFYSDFISGVQRLKNGNTLICEGASGRFFEIDENENLVWEYVNPVNDLGAITQNTNPVDNNVFRCTKYAADYAGFDGKSLVPQGYIELGSTFECSTSTLPADIKILADCIDIYPNPVTNEFTIVGELGLYEIEILDMNGQVYQIINSGGNAYTIDISTLPQGLYFIRVVNMTNNLLYAQMIIKE